MRPLVSIKSYLRLIRYKLNTDDNLDKHIEATISWILLAICFFILLTMSVTS